MLSEWFRMAGAWEAVMTHPRSAFLSNPSREDDTSSKNVLLSVILSQGDVFFYLWELPKFALHEFIRIFVEENRSAINLFTSN